MWPFVCLSQHHESVALATAETSRAGLRASSFWRDRRLCCSWGTRQKERGREKNPPPPPPIISSSHSAAPYSSSLPLRLLLVSHSLLLSLYYLVLPSLSPLPLQCSCFLFLPQSLQLSEDLLAQGEWQTALCEVQGGLEISVGSRRFIKKAFSMKRSECL